MDARWANELDSGAEGALDVDCDLSASDARHHLIYSRIEPHLILNVTSESYVGRNQGGGSSGPFPACWGANGHFVDDKQLRE